MRAGQPAHALIRTARLRWKHIQEAPSVLHERRRQLLRARTRGQLNQAARAHFEAELSVPFATMCKADALFDGLGTRLTAHECDASETMRREFLNQGVDVLTIARRELERH